MCSWKANNYCWGLCGILTQKNKDYGKCGKLPEYHLRVWVLCWVLSGGTLPSLLLTELEHEARVGFTSISLEPDCSVSVPHVYCWQRVLWHENGKPTVISAAWGNCSRVLLRIFLKGHFSRCFTLLIATAGTSPVLSSLCLSSLKKEFFPELSMTPHACHFPADADWHQTFSATRYSCELVSHSNYGSFCWESDHS